MRRVILSRVPQRSTFSFFVLALTACQSGAVIGATCQRASDCSSPLVCRLGRCRNECNVNRDCALGTQCFLDSAGLGACQLEQDRSCGSGGGCGNGLDCLRGMCVRACTSARECASDGMCSIASGAPLGFCVDPRPFDAGVVGDGGNVCRPMLATSICANGSYACAVTRDGGVLCWGGQDDAVPVLGRTIGSAMCGTTPCSAIPTRVPLHAGGMITSARSVVCGGTFACARLADGSLRCWGAQNGGQLGTSDPIGTFGAVEPRLMNDSALPPTQVVSLGVDHGCALSPANDITCWGIDLAGELGRGAIGVPPRPAPAPQLMVHPPTGVLTLGATGRTTCVVLAGSPPTVSCVGANSMGELGADPTMVTGSTTPVTVARAVVDPAMPALYASHRGMCTIDPTHHIACWGDDAGGALGRGVFITNDWMAAGLAGAAAMRTFTTVFPGSVAHCASSEADVYCWGDTSGGALNVDPSTLSTEVTAMLGRELHDLTAGACGEGFCCGIHGDQSVVCWGANTNGQLGRGAPGPDDFHPAAVCAP